MPDTFQSLEEALAHLRREPDQVVRARVKDLTVELRAVREGACARSAADVFREIGPWAGETTEEIFAILGEGRSRPDRRAVKEM
ncbi:MAG: hypothetical protein HZA54_17860 [Planctomycetes bacterium]|nr:hypothetical protein [Planctomycetota bacterium]